MNNPPIYALAPRSNNQVAIHDARTGALKRVIQYHGKLINMQANGSMGVLTIQELGGVYCHTYDLNTATLKSRFRAH